MKIILMLLLCSQMSFAVTLGCEKCGQGGDLYQINYTYGRDNKTCSYTLCYDCMEKYREKMKEFINERVSKFIGNGGEL